MEDKLNAQAVDWRAEMAAASYKYGVTVAWIAIVFNPLFAVTDYFNLPAHFNDFLIFRLAVSVVTIVVLLFKKRLEESPEVLALVPFIGISVQNAYMYSVMNPAELEKHTFAYIALFIGAGMFILWRPVFSWVVVGLSFIANFIFFGINSTLTADEVLLNGGMLTASVALFTILLIHTRYNLTKKEIIARLALAETYKQVALKNAIIEERNKDIRDSINYARRIQQAILPATERITDTLADHFILYKPKDIVSGDFYWHASVRTTPAGMPGEPIIVMAAADCTGHGVPGALMSIIGNTILNQSIKNTDVNTPAEALDFLNRELNRNLKDISDGMDIALIAINFDKLEMQYAGANNPVYIIRNGDFIEIKPNRMAVGGDNKANKEFKNHVIPLQKGDSIYLFTDGYADQFGGPKGKKFSYKNFRELLLDIQDIDMEGQKKALDYQHEKWRGDLEQVDDILAIGIRI